MDKDQLAVLYVYSLYSNEEKHKYLQYTAALVIFYYLMKKGFFPDYKDELLIYDYKDSRRFLWEDKKFMNDINIIRGFDFLIRSRAQTVNYRNINAHQCSVKGEMHLEELAYKNSSVAENIRKTLTCKCNKIMEVQLDDDTPRLVCKSCKQSMAVNGFLVNLHEPVREKFKPAFL